MLNKFITSLFAAAILGCASNPTGPANGSNPILPVIDVHTHTDFDDKPEATSGIPFTLHQYLDERARAGVVASVSHDAKEGRGNSDLREHHVIHCGAVVEKIPLRQLEDGLKSGRLGCLKIYLGYIYHYAYDPIYEPAYKLAEKYDVPVVFHTGDTYSQIGLLKYSDPLSIDEVAVRHPRVKFLIAHMGNPWIQSAAEVAYKNPNVYIEASGVMIGDLKKAKRMDIEEYLIKPLRWMYGYVEDPKKILYGTDWPLVNMEAYLAAYQEAIPREAWPLVFYENARELFKFKDLPPIATE